MKETIYKKFGIFLYIGRYTYLLKFSYLKIKDKIVNKTVKMKGRIERKKSYQNLVSLCTHTSIDNTIK